MTETTFTPVREIWEGGTGVPVPVYRGTFKGETLHTFGMGQARKAIDWLDGRDHRFAVYAKIDGIEREVARGR